MNSLECSGHIFTLHSEGYEITDSYFEEMHSQMTLLRHKSRQVSIISKACLLIAFKPKYKVLGIVIVAKA